jgi:intein/homing endonuclease
MAEGKLNLDFNNHIYYIVLGEHMKTFTDIGQFRNTIRSVKVHHDYKGLDETEAPIYRHDSPYPKLTFNGTIKLHGTNSGIILYKDGHIEYQSRERVLELGSDNNGFMLAMSNIDVKKLFEGIEFKDYCAIYGEYCGCFPYNTPILLSNGTTLPIGKIVRKKLKVEILSYNITTHKLEPKKVINFHINGKTNEWLKINVQRRKRGGRFTGFIVTPTHSVFIKKNNKILEKKADNLKINDKLLFPGKILSYNVKQFLMGTILGDGCLDNAGSIRISHSDDNQKFYNDFIQDNFKNIITSIKKRISGYGSNMRVFTIKVFEEMKDIRKELYKKENKKHITISYLNKLSPLALAVWYMDDGSIIHHNKEGRQDRCSLHCQGFGTKNVKLIESWLNSKGYYCYTVYEDKELGTEIRFTVEGASAFLYTISPYILKEFNYKLPTIFHKIEKISWWDDYINEYDQSLIEAKIENIEKYIPLEEYKKFKYDIQIEDNSNYFANNILVHNSSIQKGMAISQLPKMWILFGIKIDDIYHDFSKFSHLKMEDKRIFNIYQFEHYSMEIDFNSPELAQNKLVDMTLKVEAECPVGKYFGIEKMVGEGIVWECLLGPSERYIFKVKGEKHSSTKVKKLASVNIEEITGLKEFIEYAVTENRMKQGIDKMIEMKIPLDIKSTGEYLRWLYNDILKEEKDTIIKNQIDPKKIGSLISAKAKIFWMKYLDELVY